MMTTASERKLKEYEKRRKKLYKKMKELIVDMTNDQMYHGLDEEYAERDMRSFNKLLRSAIATKEEFAMNFNDKFNEPETEKKAC